MYHIQFDEPSLLVTATLEGYWSPQLVNRYALEVFPLLRRVARQRGFARFLVRSAAMPVQSAEVAQAFGKFMLELVEISPGPIAVAVGSMLNKMQASRTFGHERIRVFMDEAAARAWLLQFRPPTHAAA